MRRQEHIEAFVEELWSWFAKYKRILPWRDLDIADDTERAYRILVSEIMLQQTQVSRVESVFPVFLEEFPSLRDLASASNREVLIAWRGMGYNARALRLRDIARSICTEHGGVFPREMNDLQSLKGIGHYTAAAIRNFAFLLPTPCLDTNIRRIIHRTFVGPECPDGTWSKGDDYLLGIAAQALTEALRNSRYTTADWHAALMDFGSLVCTKTHPRWDICPLTRRGICKAAYKVSHGRKKAKEEPGRLVGSTFVPNRIFRGKIIEELRDEPRGLPREEIGRRICADWSPRHHRKWLGGLLKKLNEDQLIVQSGSRYALYQ